MTSSKQIKFGALMSYFAIAVNIVAGLVYTPWMITKIGQGNYGLYTIASSLIRQVSLNLCCEGRAGKCRQFYGLGL